jgi:hypothetical protein
MQIEGAEKYRVYETLNHDNIVMTAKFVNKNDVNYATLP